MYANNSFHSQTAKLMPIRGAYGLKAQSTSAKRAAKWQATHKANLQAAKRQHNQEVWASFWYEIKCGLVAFGIIFALLVITLH